MSDLRFAFAGDRDVSVWVLKFLLEHDARPLALLVSDTDKATHANELISLCPFLSAHEILVGKAFQQPENITRLKAFDLDYVIGVHFPYIIPSEVLEIPKIGILNLHPAYLPYNRGWHTPSWAILEDTPIGATLHFMDSELDTGDIVYQKQADIYPDDTADSLYRRIKKLELDAFSEAWPLITSRNPPRMKQQTGAGTFHIKRDLASIQLIDLDELTNTRDFLKRLRGLTTNRLDEAAFFEENGKRYRVQVTILVDKRYD